MKVKQQVFFLCMFLMLLGLRVDGAEFSPSLQAQLQLKKPVDPISAIVIFESPIDIRALDMRLL